MWLSYDYLIPSVAALAFLCICGSCVALWHYKRKSESTPDDSKSKKSTTPKVKTYKSKKKTNPDIKSNRSNKSIKPDIKPVSAEKQVQAESPQGGKLEMGKHKKKNKKKKKNNKNKNQRQKDKEEREPKMKSEDTSESDDDNDTAEEMSVKSQESLQAGKAGAKSPTDSSSNQTPTGSSVNKRKTKSKSHESSPQSCPETKSDAAKSENQPNSSMSIDPKSIDSKSIDSKSIDPKSIDPKSIDPKSIDPKSIDPKSIDSKSIDPKSIDPKSIDPKSIDPKSQPNLPKSIESKSQEKESSSQGKNDRAENKSASNKSRPKSKCSESETILPVKPRESETETDSNQKKQKSNKEKPHTSGYDNQTVKGGRAEGLNDRQASQHIYEGKNAGDRKESRKGNQARTSNKRESQPVRPQDKYADQNQHPNKKLPYCYLCKGYIHDPWVTGACPNVLLSTATNITPFGGEGDVLSNFYPCRIRVFDWEFRTSEHAYQWRKSNICGRQDVGLEICEALDGRQVKKLSKQIQTNEEWEACKYEIMFEIITAKASDVPEYSRALQESREIIVEAVPGDKIWSCGMAKEDALYVKPLAWPGQNRMGRLHMRLRNTLFGPCESELLKQYLNFMPEVQKFVKKQRSTSKDGANRWGRNSGAREKGTSIWREREPRKQQGSKPDKLNRNWNNSDLETEDYHARSKDGKKSEFRGNRDKSRDGKHFDDGGKRDGSIGDDGPKGDKSAPSNMDYWDDDCASKQVDSKQGSGGDNVGSVRSRSRSDDSRDRNHSNKRQSSQESDRGDSDRKRHRSQSRDIRS